MITTLHYFKPPAKPMTSAGLGALHEMNRALFAEFHFSRRLDTRKTDKTYVRALWESRDRAYFGYDPYNHNPVDA